MDDIHRQSQDTFERLLDAMPRIAEAVNAFTDDKNQRAALDALVRAIGVPSAALGVALGREERGTGLPVAESLPDADDLDGEGSPDAGGGSGEGSTPIRSARRKRNSKKWEAVRDIDFRPEGKTSFRDFVAEKLPTSIDQKNVVAVYWLEQVAEVQDIGVGQVLAAYKEMNWREPSVPDNALQVTASREHWLDTKNMKALVTTPSGRNLVNHDMPIAKAKRAT